MSTFNIFSDFKSKSTFRILNSVHSSSYPHYPLLQTMRPPRSVEFSTLEKEAELSGTDSVTSRNALTFCTKYRPYIVVIAAIMIELGSAWHAVFGNYLSYMASFMTAKNIDPTNNDIDYIESRYNHYSDQIAWTYSIWVIIYSLTMSVGGKIEYKFGPKIVIFIGSLLIMLGLLSTYLVFEYTDNAYYLYFSYGILLGSGAGIMFTTPYLVGMRWFEHANAKGFVSGLIFSGISWSSMMFNLLSTQFVNPDNVEIDQRIGFVQQQSVLDNVSTSFLKFAVLCFCLFLFGIIFLQNPPSFNHQSQHNVESKKKKHSIYSDYDMNIDSNEETKKKNSDQISLIQQNKDQEISLKSILCQPKFWNLFLTILVLPVTYVYSQWKEFNNRYLGIENDQILSIMASTSGIAEGVSRMFWGWIFDKLQSKEKNAYKILMGYIAFLCIVFIASWTQLAHINDDDILIVFAFIWLIVLYTILSGALTLLPIQTAHIYGTHKGGIVYGLLYCARIGGTLFSMTAVIETRQLLGWFYMNNFWVGTQCILLILVLTSKSK